MLLNARRRKPTLNGISQGQQELKARSVHKDLKENRDCRGRSVHKGFKEKPAHKVKEGYKANKGHKEKKAYRVQSDQKDLLDHRDQLALLLHWNRLRAFLVTMVLEVCS
jgi:hypothetical protein